MGMRLGFCEVVFCIAEFCCQSSKEFIPMQQNFFGITEFSKQQIFHLAASILQFSVLQSFTIKATDSFSMQQILFVFLNFQSNRQIFRSSKQRAELAGRI